LNEFFEADQQRIPSECGEALIGRISVAGRAKWQYLPDSLSGSLQEVYEPIRPDPEIADSKPAGQRSWM
jgi:hypothetical protein